MGVPGGGHSTDDLGIETPDEDDRRSRLIGLERDLPAALRYSIEQLEPGLDIIDGGTERSVDSGFIDITANAADGTVVVIELKAGTARRDAVGQILSYMGDVATEDSDPVHGFLVAGDFDNTGPPWRHSRWRGAHRPRSDAQEPVRIGARAQPRAVTSGRILGLPCRGRAILVVS